MKCLQKIRYASAFALWMSFPWLGYAVEETPLTALPYHPGLDYSFMNKKADPCTDFYTYVCGGWQKKNPIPPDQSSWSILDRVDRENTQFLWGLLQTAAKNVPTRSSEEQKIGDYFASCMDEKAIERAGLDPLIPDLLMIQKINSLDDLPATLAHLQSIIGSKEMMFAFGSDQDLHDASKVIATFVAGGLGLPDRDYYLDQEAKQKKVRTEYVHYIQKMLVLSGWSLKEAKKWSQHILRLETELAKASLTNVEKRDPSKLDHRMTIAEMQTLVPGLSWKPYFTALGLSEIDSMNVREPKFFRQLGILLTEENLNLWKAYLRFHVLSKRAPYLSSAFVKEEFTFHGKYLRGVKELQPRWKRCVGYTDNDLGEALGKLFVEKAFPKANKDKILTMVYQIESEMESQLKALSWMEESTKQQALIKLKLMRNKVGYPDHFRDYTKLDIQAKDFVGNVNRSGIFEAQYQLSKIGKATDPDEWLMTPSTVNAYYYANTNDINFPAGILQPPFFDARMEDGINFAKIGSVIGHEITHGFDDEGRRFDGEGNLKDWWSKKDASQFASRAQCIEQQYNQYRAIDQLYVNGRLTLGENIADLGGFGLAYHAWEKAMANSTDSTQDKAGFTAQQRFFIAFGQWECSNERPEYIRLRVRTNPHAPPKFRIQGVLVNIPEFQKAFHCPAQLPMVGQQRCQVW